MDQWYNSTKYDVADNVIGTFKSIDQTQSYRLARQRRNISMYSSLGSQGLSVQNYTDALTDNRLQLNVVRAVIDTAIAMLSTNRPKPYFLTVGGDEELQRRARNLNKFTLGQFLATNIYSKTPYSFLDASLTGNGYVKIFDADDEVQAERVWSPEIVVDDAEAKYGCPRSMYQYKEVSKHVLMARYPKAAGAIDSAGLLREGSLSPVQAVERPVGVLEAWHLPSKSGGKDGRHVICVDGATLFDEDWTDSEFPFAVLRIGLEPIGYWAHGFVTPLRGIQREINALLMKIQRHLKLGSTKVFIEAHSNAAKVRMTNEEFEIIPYTGKPPVIAAVQAISPEYGQMLEYLYNKAFEISGISQLSAQSKKPAGLDSGAAIREYNDVQSARFLHVGQAWEQFHIDIAKRMVKLARKIDQEGKGSYKIMAKSDRGLELIKWKDVSLDEDKYQIQVWPASLLPNSPSGKLQAVKELASTFPEIQPYALGLLDLPDLDAVTSLVNAPKQAIDMIISEILEDGRYIGPEPFMDLNLGIRQMQLSYIRAKIDGVPEDKLELMRSWIEQAADMLQPPEPPAPPMPQPGPEAMPPGPVPGGPPVAGPPIPPEAIPTM